MVQYTKEALDYAQQIRQLQGRGLAIVDPVKAELYLRKVGYYRLMGYLFPLRVAGGDTYLPGASIDTALRLYEFDRHLRHLVGDAIGHIEVAARTAVTYRLAHAYGSFAHRNAANFRPDGGKGNWHESWLSKVDEQVCRARETFIDHYKCRYTIPPFPEVPIYMASEVMSLGTLSKLVCAMHSVDQAAIATEFHTDIPVLLSWLHAVSVVRNIAAHHGRLWNRVLGVSPKLPRHGVWAGTSSTVPQTRLFFMLCVLNHLLKDTAANITHWRTTVSDHLRPLLVDPSRRASMGAPDNWETHALWQ
ncbi:Abi family protein [Xanthomonas fragariae]|uniref:Abi family protein n=1 Tax=Xanthomonas fragariae TaxID=48664 RepID=UPI000A35D38E|nr:Abi family protein [Xanthomonas fragariae]SMQ93776.1 abortive infection bacteriophage resistance protein [Xanthomonas fragariae]